MTRLIKALLLTLLPCLIYSNNIQVANIAFDQSNNKVTCQVSWENPWKVSNNWYDAAWVFVKYRNANSAQWKHFRMDANVLSGTPTPQGVMKATPADPVGSYSGILVYLNSAQSSFDSISITLEMTAHQDMQFYLPEFKVFAVEMVHFNWGNESYYIGDGASDRRWHLGSDTLQPFHYTPAMYNSGINVGTGSDEINLLSQFPITITNIPGSMVRPPMWVMKHKITNEQYADFLNTLTRAQQNTVTKADVSGNTVPNYFVMEDGTTPIGRVSIRCDEDVPNAGPIEFYCDLNNNTIPNEYDDGQNVVVGYLSPLAYTAYLDWACMMPMTDLQLEGLCRGTETPIAEEYAWGDAGYTEITSLPATTKGTPEEAPSTSGTPGPYYNERRVAWAADSTSTRLTSGGSAIGVFDLSSNNYELLIKVEYQNSVDNWVDEVGDGILNPDGSSDAPWVDCVYGTKGYLKTVSETTQGLNPFDAFNYRSTGRGVIKF